MNYVVLNVFDEMPNIGRAVNSVRKHFSNPVFVFADGAYPEWDSEHRLSTDGTAEFARNNGVYLPLPDTDECAKRTAALRYIDTVAVAGDWVLVLDADEEITGIFGTATRVGSIDFTRTAGLIVNYGRCRYYRWEPGLYFAGKHYLLWDSAGELVSSLEDAPDFDLIGTGKHHNKAHSPKRFKTKRAYYEVLRKREEQVKVGAWA